MFCTLLYIYYCNVHCSVKDSVSYLRKQTNQVTLRAPVKDALQSIAVNATDLTNIMANFQDDLDTKLPYNQQTILLVPKHVSNEFKTFFTNFLSSKRYYFALLACNFFVLFVFMSITNFYG